MSKCGYDLYNQAEFLYLRIEIDSKRAKKSRVRRWSETSLSSTDLMTLENEMTLDHIDSAAGALDTDQQAEVVPELGQGQIEASADVGIPSDAQSSPGKFVRMFSKYLYK